MSSTSQIKTNPSHRGTKNGFFWPYVQFFTGYYINQLADRKQKKFLAFSNILKKWNLSIPKRVTNTVRGIHKTFMTDVSQSALANTKQHQFFLSSKLLLENPKKKKTLLQAYPSTTDKSWCCLAKSEDKHDHRASVTFGYTSWQMCVSFVWCVACMFFFSFLIWFIRSQMCSFRTATTVRKATDFRLESYRPNQPKYLPENYGV